MTEIQHAPWCANQRSTLDVDGFFHECRSNPERVQDAERQTVRVGLSMRSGDPAAVTLEGFRLTPEQARQLAAALVSSAAAADAT